MYTIQYGLKIKYDHLLGSRRSSSISVLERRGVDSSSELPAIEYQKQNKTC